MVQFCCLINLNIVSIFIPFSFEHDCAHLFVLCGFEINQWWEGFVVAHFILHSQLKFQFKHTKWIEQSEFELNCPSNLRNLIPAGGDIHLLHGLQLKCVFFPCLQLRWLLKSQNLQAYRIRAFYFTLNDATAVIILFGF